MAQLPVPAPPTAAMPYGVQTPSNRAATAQQIRQQAAAFEFGKALPNHTNNGDEALYPNKIGSYSKGLPEPKDSLSNPKSPLRPLILRVFDQQHIAIPSSRDSLNPSLNCRNDNSSDDCERERLLEQLSLKRVRIRIGGTMAIPVK